MIDLLILWLGLYTTEPSLTMSVITCWCLLAKDTLPQLFALRLDKITKGMYNGVESAVFKANHVGN
jgi:hypothetical protein